MRYRGKNNMKHKKLIIMLAIALAIIIIFSGVYFYGLTPVTKNKEVVDFTIATETSKLDIINELKSSGIIKSKLSSYIYIIFNRHLNLQAGTYELSKNMSTPDILKQIASGKIKESKDNTYQLRFIEGKKLTDYADIIAKSTKLAREDVLKIMNDKTYLQELIAKYWFLTDDILKEGIYYPLEGYLFPDTYEFYNNASIKDIITKMLDETAVKLNSVKDEITNSSYSIHEIITISSIVESEGANSLDRKGVAGVFYNRLNDNWALGSDVTTYYGVKKDFSSDLYQAEIDACNPYNTRGTCAISGLPIGPISNPSLESIIAALNPSNHDYYYFVADKNKKTYFTKTYNEHVAKTNELKATGLWFTY